MPLIRELPTGSMVVGKLPRGCELCQRGRKSVIFITGLCPRKCFYCPLSRDRRRDILFINEKAVLKLDEKTLISEILKSDSLGVGITGGDPLVKLERTFFIIKVLKDYFPEMHIHLYTTGVTLTKTVLSKLDKIGLDELRIHPKPRNWDKIELALRESSMDVGAEIPALPGSEREIIKFAEYLTDIGAHFLNINELEFSETNAIALLQRGYRMNEDYITAKGSKDTAIRVLKQAARELDLNIHFCPAVVKDRYQTSLRLYRKAIVTAKNYQQVTDEGLLKYLEIIAENPGKIRELIPAPLLETTEGKAYTSVFFADRLMKAGYDVYVVEESPTPQRQILNREKYKPY